MLSTLRTGAWAARVVSRSARTGAAIQHAATRAFAVKSASELGLDKMGISARSDIHFNLSYDEINEHEIKYNEGEVATGKGDCFTISTAPFYGRSPKDRYIVEQSPSSEFVDWGDINMPMKPEVFDTLYDRVVDHLGNHAERLYVLDAFVGTSPEERRKVRFVTQFAWQHHFVKNMFVRPTEEELKDWGEPDFVILNACTITNPDFKEHGLRSEVFVGFNIEKAVGIIGGTHYGGEMKKGIFAMMNYWLPRSGHLSMHCSANKGANGDTALFFGLSGTGKTTLSADPNRYLIGDDEHGWDSTGIFNFEGGCYAKTIDLTHEAEPEIYDAIRRDALMENVKIDNGVPDFTYKAHTENGRVSYPIFHIPNFDEGSKGGHPNAVIFLTCDAYGVLPPVSRLTSDQAMYHFLSGYTAKIPGTELGVSEPEPTFSACFGAVFMPLHPFVYADLLKNKLEKHGSKAYLVNTGWSGGAYPNGSRMSIKVTRTCIDGILDGSISDSEFATHPVMNVEYPTNLGAVDPSILDPREAWEDKEAYDKQASALAELFKSNFAKFTGDASAYAQHGPN